MLKKFQLNYLIFLLLVVTGCSTYQVRLDDLNYALTDLQKTVETHLPVGKRKVSPNAREFYSEYFVISKEGEFEDATTKPTRNYAHVLILGDRRPYAIEAMVHVERRVGAGQYDQVKYDEGLARVIIRRIQKALHQRREDRNIIDDFRVF